MRRVKSRSTSSRAERTELGVEGRGVDEEKGEAIPGSL